MEMDLFAIVQCSHEGDLRLTRCTSFPLCQNCVQVIFASFSASFLLYFYSNVPFSLQLIVCRYVTVVDFYVPIQFYSFFCSNFLPHESNVFLCRFFAHSLFTFFIIFQRRNDFYVSSTEAFFWCVFFIVARAAEISLVLHTSSLEAMNVIECMDACIEQWRCTSLLYAK